MYEIFLILSKNVFILFVNNSSVWCMAAVDLLEGGSSEQRLQETENKGLCFH